MEVPLRFVVDFTAVLVGITVVIVALEVSPGVGVDGAMLDAKVEESTISQFDSIDSTTVASVSLFAFAKH